MMVDPLSVVTAILTVAQLIRSAASTVKQNKVNCRELAERAQTLAHVLPSLACMNDAATARVLERLRVAVDEALKLIRSCQSAGMFSSSRKAGELDSLDKRINNSLSRLEKLGSREQDLEEPTDHSRRVAAGGSSPVVYPMRAAASAARQHGRWRS